MSVISIESILSGQDDFTDPNGDKPVTEPEVSIKESVKEHETNETKADSPTDKDESTTSSSSSGSSEPREILAQIVSYRDHRFCMMPDDAILRHIKTQGKVWEQHLIDTFKNLLNEKSFCLDVGAHVGLHSLEMARIAKCVVSIEPFWVSHQLLSKNVDLNRANNVAVFNAALGVRLGKCSVLRSPDMNKKGEKNFGDTSFRESVDGNVRLETLDHLYDDNPIIFHGLDFIKMDAQGSEVFILQGAKKTIQKHRPYMVIEVEDFQLKRLQSSSYNLFRLIAEFGYVPILIQSEYACDHLCVPVEKMDYFKRRFWEQIKPFSLSPSTSDGQNDTDKGKEKSGKEEQDISKNKQFVDFMIQW